METIVDDFMTWLGYFILANWDNQTWKPMVKLRMFCNSSLQNKYNERITPHDAYQKNWICFNEIIAILLCLALQLCNYFLTFSQPLSDNSLMIASCRWKNKFLRANNVQFCNGGIMVDRNYFRKLHSCSEFQYLSPLQPSIQLYSCTLGFAYLCLIIPAAWIAMMQNLFVSGQRQMIKLGLQSYFRVLSSSL